MKIDLLQIKQQHLNEDLVEITKKQYDEIVIEILFNRLTGDRIEVSDYETHTTTPGYRFITPFGQLRLVCPELGMKFIPEDDDAKWYEFWR